MIATLPHPDWILKLFNAKSADIQETLLSRLNQEQMDQYDQALIDETERMELIAKEMASIDLTQSVVSQLKHLHEIEKRYPLPSGKQYMDSF